VTEGATFTAEEYASAGIRTRSRSRRSGIGSGSGAGSYTKARCGGAGGAHSIVAAAVFAPWLSPYDPLIGKARGPVGKRLLVLLGPIH